MDYYDILLCFFVYGFLGWCTEVAFATVEQRRFVNRGFLNGPICPIYGIGVVSVVEILDPLIGQTVLLYFGSVVLATALEWVTGFLLEKLFHQKWWDYSNMPLNLNGYVCVLFSMVWGVACVAIVRYIHPFILGLLALPPMWVGMPVLTTLLVLLAADVYVTVTVILEFNRSLEKMEEIALELQKLSDQIGGNISRNVLESLEIQEDAKNKAEETFLYLRGKTEEKKSQAEALIEEQKRKMEELKLKYRELVDGKSSAVRRMIKAFPKMKPIRYEKQFQDLKRYLMKRKPEKKHK